jgi:hypothetical protein
VVSEQANGSQLRRLAHLRMLVRHQPCYSAGRDQVAGTQIIGNLCQELVRGVPVPVSHQDFVTHIQGLTARTGAFEPGMLAETKDPGQYDVA